MYTRLISSDFKRYGNIARRAWRHCTRINVQHSTRLRWGSLKILKRGTWTWKVESGNKVQGYKAINHIQAPSKDEQIGKYHFWWYVHHHGRGREQAWARFVIVFSSMVPKFAVFWGLECANAVLSVSYAANAPLSTLSTIFALHLAPSPSPPSSHHTNK